MYRTVIAACATACVAGAAAHASTTYPGYPGIVFPDGDRSFADRVVSFVLGDGVGGDHADPEAVLGIPGATLAGSSGRFALGRPGQSPDNLDNGLFGSVTVQFTDNALTTSGDAAADLYIFEFGAAIERFSVEISTTGTTWIDIGTVTGQPSQIDIDGQPGVTEGTLYSFVRVSDAPDGASSSGPIFAGPDIDAIGAISSAPPPVVPLPAAGWLALMGIGALGALRAGKKSRKTDG